MDSKTVWAQAKKDGKGVRRDAFGVRILTDAETQARYDAQVKAKSTGYESPRELNRRLVREMLEEQDRKDPVKIAERQATKTLLELKDELYNYWSGDLTRIAKTYLDTPLDPLIQVPRATESYTQEQFLAAADQWYVTNPDIELSNEGRRRLLAYCMCQAQHGLDFSKPESFNIAFYHLAQVFQPGEVLKMPEPVEPEPPKPALSEIDQTKEDFYKGSLVNQWRESLLTNFGFRIGNEDLRYLLGTDDTSRDPMKRGWFWRNNLSIYSPQSFDLARRHLVAIGRWERALLTEDERLAERIEKADLDNYQERSNIKTSLMGDGVNFPPTILTPRKR